MKSLCAGSNRIVYRLSGRDKPGPCPVCGKALKLGFVVGMPTGAVRVPRHNAASGVAP